MYVGYLLPCVTLTSHALPPHQTRVPACIPASQQVPSPPDPKPAQQLEHREGTSQQAGQQSNKHPNQAQSACSSITIGCRGQLASTNTDAILPQTCVSQLTHEQKIMYSVSIDIIVFESLKRMC